MGITVATYDIDGVACIVPDRNGDARGFFCELFRDDLFRREVADVGFVQDNLSRSEASGTVRGLHFQAPPAAQGKLVRCMSGAILDVVVDIRRGSPTYGRHLAVELTPENGRWLWAPPGFAHGFCTLRPGSEVLYKVTAPYSPAHDAGLAFDDPDLGVPWPVEPAAAATSARDRAHPRLRDLDSPFTYGAEA